MRHNKTVEVPTTTKEVFDKKACDMCGKESKQYGNDWEPDYYDHNEVTICHFMGAQYPGDDIKHGEEFNPDICPDCFIAIIIPVLKKHSVTINYKEIE